MIPASKKYNLLCNFLYSLYMLSAYFAESNNTLTIYCPVNQYNSKQMANQTSYVNINAHFLTMNCLQNVIAKKISEVTRKHSCREWESTSVLIRYCYENQKVSGSNPTNCSAGLKDLVKRLPVTFRSIL